LAGIRRSALSVTQGADGVLIYGDEDATHDVRCGRCGSLLYSVVRAGEYAHVPMGALVTDPSIRPSMHIFTGSKASWDSIDDDLAQHDGLPPHG
jgi:hypothetical protein